MKYRLGLLIFLGVIVLAAVFLFRPKFWNAFGKLILLTNGRDGNVRVSVIDPKEKGWAEIYIPGTVQVTVAGELGSWRLGSVWQLGVNEKIGGDLLARTVVKNFGFPVVAWQDELTGRTNLSLGDRIRLWLLKLKMSRRPSETIDLTKTSFLKKTKLVDGEWGWRIVGEIPSGVAAYFPEEAVLQTGYRARIINYSGSIALGESVGRVIEVMGVKVASVQKEESQDFDCAITGHDNRLVKRLNLVFACKDKMIEGSDGFDLNLEVGRNFSRRF